MRDKAQTYLQNWAPLLLSLGQSFFSFLVLKNYPSLCSPSGTFNIIFLKNSGIYKLGEKIMPWESLLSASPKFLRSRSPKSSGYLCAKDEQARRESKHSYSDFNKLFLQWLLFSWNLWGSWIYCLIKSWENINFKSKWGICENFNSLKESAV